jgi:hypothetical protein
LVKSTYLSQFEGLTTRADFAPLWTIVAEPKHRFFGWLILHQRALTAEICFDDIALVIGYAAYAPVLSRMQHTTQTVAKPGFKHEGGQLPMSNNVTIK